MLDNGSLKDTCITGINAARTAPVCNKVFGACVNCQGDDGQAGTGNGTTEGTRGNCPLDSTFCCTDGSCANTGDCPTKFLAAPWDKIGH